MQPYIFPYLGYFQLLHASDKFVVYDDVSFIKQGWINRNRILVNHQPYLFTVPVKNISSFTTIAQTEINNFNSWKTKFLVTLRHAYSHSPFFTSVFKMIEEMLAHELHTISELAVKSIEMVATYLAIPVRVLGTAHQYKNNALKGQQRVIDICLQEQAGVYINASGGSELYSKDDFARHNISLKFIQPEIPEYRQFKNDFIPALSIIDVMMFNAPETIQQMLNQYQLI